MEPTAKAKTSVTEVMVTATPACERALPILSFRLNAWLKTLTLFQSNFYEENFASFIGHFKLSCGQFNKQFMLVIFAGWYSFGEALILKITFKCELFRFIKMK